MNTLIVSFQTAGIVCGLPYVCIVCVMCVSIWRAVNVAVGNLDPFGPKFSVGLFDCWAAHPFKQIKMESKMIGYLFMKFLKVEKYQNEINISDLFSKNINILMRYLMTRS